MKSTEELMPNNPSIVRQSFKYADHCKKLRPIGWLALELLLQVSLYNILQYQMVV